MAWLRLYDDILDDPKFQMLSDRAFRALINLWCLAKRHGGKIPSDLNSIAFSLRWPVGKVRETLQALISAKLIDHTETGFEPHDWNTHQYQSDVSTERVKRFRERSSKQDETVTETPPETEQIQKAESEQKKVIPASRPKAARSKPTSKPILNGHEKDFNEFWAVYPKRVDKRDAMKAYAKALSRADASVIFGGAQGYARSRKDEDAQFTKGPAHWLNADCWLDEAPLSDDAPDPKLKEMQEAEAAFRKEKGYE